MPDPGPIVDANVHLWDNARNPVFWLTDRSLVRDLIGDYDALPDTYTLRDYELETASLDVSGVVWSDAGAEDPVAAAEWVSEQDGGRGFVRGLVSLGDPTQAGFAHLLEALDRVPIVSSVRVRLAAGLVADGAQHLSPRQAYLDQPLVSEHLDTMTRRGLVATIEATADQLDVVAHVADAKPDLRIVVDHFGWPTDLSDPGRTAHLARLSELASRPNVATRIDALGTIFGAWDVETLRAWLPPVVDAFGADRCMLGSDLPIERLRSSVDGVYASYATVFADGATHDRQELLHGTAERWYGRAGR